MGVLLQMQGCGLRCQLRGREPCPKAGAHAVSSTLFPHCSVSTCPTPPHLTPDTLVLLPSQVPDELFSTLLAYLEGLRGCAREVTVRKAEALMRELDEASGTDPLPPGKTQRIRQVLQLLS